MHLTAPCHKSEPPPPDISCSGLMTIQQDATPTWTKRIGEDSLAPCALICWLTAERQHCLSNVGRVKGHCIAFVRSAVEVTLSSGPSCCRQLGHATYMESNYPCQLITARLVPERGEQNSLKYNERLCVCDVLVSLHCRHTNLGPGLRKRRSIAKRLPTKQTNLNKNNSKRNKILQSQTWQLTKWYKDG